MHSENKRFDFMVTVLLLVIGALICFYMSPSNPIVYILYLGIPSAFLMLRKKKNYRKIFWGVFLFGALMGGVFDFIASLNNAWFFTKPLFSFMIGGWLVENLLAYMFMTLFIIVFYEHFLDDEKHPRLSQDHSEAFLFLSIISIFVALLFSFFPEQLQVSHFYLKAGLAAVIYPIVFSFRNPKIIEKFTALAFFFFFVWLVAEFIGLSNGNWVFPASDQYIGLVSLFNVTFPFEEVFFWFMWYPVVVIAYYEHFVDDGK